MFQMHASSSSARLATRHGVDTRSSNVAQRTSIMLPARPKHSAQVVKFSQTQRPRSAHLAPKTVAMLSDSAENARDAKKRVHSTALQAQTVASGVTDDPEDNTPVLDTSGGNNGGPDGGSEGNGGGGGGGDNEGGKGDEGEGESKFDEKSLALKLSQNGYAVSDVQPGLVEALVSGRVGLAVLNSWFQLQKAPLTKFLSQFQGFLERMLGDHMFLTKVAIECGVGLFTKSTAEKAKRGDNFFKELDFVFANVLMAIIADFMLVWLPAPTIALSAIGKTSGGNAVSRFFASCPDNAFQMVKDGRKFTVAQRFGAVARNGTKLMGVGLASSFIGTVVITSVLMGMRKFVGVQGASTDSAKKSEPKDPNKKEIPVAQTCLAYGTYMATSSNLRYQMLAGFEQRCLEPLLAKQSALLGALCFALRTGNTFLGSLLWVDFTRIVGIAPKASS